MSSGAVSKGSKGSKPKKPNGWKYMTPWERVRNLVGLSIFLVPVVYGTATVLFSGTVNRAFHNPQQCTIEFAAAGESRTRSYSSSRYVVVRTSECGDMRFVGNRNGLTRTEVANRIDALAGERVTVEVGVWQMPFSPTMIVGIEGLDLENQ